MRVIAIIAAAVVLLTGCSGSKEEPAATQAPASTAPARETPVTPAKATTPLTGNEVIVEFAAANLPIGNVRDNSKNCVKLGCVELVTTDDVSIYVWHDAAAQKHFATTFGSEAFSAGNVVLEYAGARTPAKMRPKYQAALTELVG